jgi:hypothetical protein
MDEPVDVVTDSVTSGLAALVAVGLAKYPELGVVAATVQPGLARALSTAVYAANARGLLRQARVLQLAEEEVSLSAEDIVQKLETTEAGQEFTARVLLASYSATMEAKILGLGRSLAYAAVDPAQIDSESLLVSAIEAVQAQHLRLLRVLASNPKASDSPAFRVVALGSWLSSDIVAADPALDLETQVILAGPLRAHGLISERQVDMTGGFGGAGVTGVQITRQGLRLLDRCREAVDAEEAR